MSAPKVGVGRIVHAVMNGECVAAMVTRDTGEEIQLHVFPSNLKDGAMFGVGQDQDGHSEGSWHYPERV